MLLVIACLSFLAQDAAASSRSSQGLPLHQVAGNALEDTGRLLGGLLWGQPGSHEGAPYWSAADAPRPLGELFRGPLLSSLILLFLAMILGGSWAGLLRFSLSSLPVVEFLFGWPGSGIPRVSASPRWYRGRPVRCALL